MDVESLWLSTSGETAFDPLAGSRRVEIAVVGGGITGLSTAYELLETGHEVAVIEGDRLATGTSGHTTAKLTSQHGVIYEHLCSRFGIDRARQYAAANEAAIDTVEDRIANLGIEAHFERTPNYVYAPSEDEAHTLRQEAHAATRLGLPAELVEDTPASVPASAALRFDNQAQFHPREYLLALADAIDAGGGDIYEQTRATSLSAGEPCRIETNRGTVTADRVVIATLFPFSDRAGFFSRMHPSRSYLLAAEIDGALPDGMYLSTESPPATFRPYRNGDEELLIVGGQSHKPQANGVPTSERYRRCELFARQHFDVETIRYRWSAHDLVPVDRVPFIGEMGRLSPHTYVATGFAKWGMTGGTAAARIIAGLIDDGRHPHAEIFDPTRFDVRSVPKFFEENTTVATRWIGDRIRAMGESFDDPAHLPEAGEGAVLRDRGRPIAVYRDEAGEVHTRSAVCPHMYCVVDWNDAESTWDCPCHGSRFDATGAVEYGPATRDLPKRDR